MYIYVTPSTEEGVVLQMCAAFIFLRIFYAFKAVNFNIIAEILVEAT